MFEINGERWYVKFTNIDNPVFIMENGDWTIGVCDDNTKTIYIADNLKRKRLKHVLCHEIVHAAMFSYDIELDYEQEEFIANLIATYGEEIIEITNKIFKRLQYI